LTPYIKLTGVDPIYDVTIKKQFMATIESLMEWHQWLRNNMSVCSAEFRHGEDEE